MRLTRLAFPAALVALGAALACRGGDETTRGSTMLADSAVVAAMKSYDTVPGRIIYDPPTDLSYASAAKMRPDLVKAPPPKAAAVQAGSRPR